VTQSRQQRPTLDPALSSRPSRREPEAQEARDLAVNSTPFRAPQAILDALKELAEAKGISRNQLILAFCDLGLRLEGRPSVEDLAPGVSAWVRREARQSAKVRR
jgi:hypothetical protein